MELVLGIGIGVIAALLAWGLLSVRHELQYRRRGDYINISSRERKQMFIQSEKE